MKRPLVGLLASAAAVPGAWLIASADEPNALPHPVPEPDSASQPLAAANPAERLAAIEPSFDPQREIELPRAAEHLGDVALPASHAIFTLPEPAVMGPAEPVARAEPIARPAAPPAGLTPELPTLADLSTPALPNFVAEPVVQPLPVKALAAAKPADTAPLAEPAPVRPMLAAAAPVRPPAPAYIAGPVVQPPPRPVLAKAEVPPAAAPPFVAKPVVQPLPAPKLADAAPVLRKIEQPVPKAAALPAPTAGPVKLAAVAEPAKPAPKPAKVLSQPASKPIAPPKPLVAKAAPTAAPTPPAPTPVVSPVVTMPPAKLPVGEVVLASYVPQPATAAPATGPATAPAIGKARGAQVETTAARTVPIGAPERVSYPEPAFGPPEAKLIPAAYSAVEPPEQPATLGSASSLAQAIAYSYETNPRLLAERASARAADFGYPAARAAFGPRLDASASLSYTRDRDEVLPGSFQRQQGWSDTASLILSQPLLTFGRSQARVGQAAANIDFRRESLRLVQNEVMLDVIAAYVGTLREAGAVTIARENVALLQRQLEESNARFAVREITLADVQQVETRLALGRTVLLDAQARLGEIQSRFYRAVGMPPGELAPPEPLTLPVAALPEAYALADNESPLVRAAQARERVSRAFLAATRAESAPRVDLRGSADYGSVSEYARDLRGTRLRGTVTLSVPLLDSGARAAESGQAREANSADLQLIAAAQRDSRTAVATGWNNLLAARMSIDHYRVAVESAQRAYENAQRQERAGMRSTLDVLDLARDLLNVRNAYNAALAEEYQARANLLATMGQLDPAKMSGGLKLYDPADNFRKVKGKGDIPLLTGTLAALDGVTLPNLKASRPSPDAAALVGTAETVTGK